MSRSVEVEGDGRYHQRHRVITCKYINISVKTSLRTRREATVKSSSFSAAFFWMACSMEPWKRCSFPALRWRFMAAVAICVVGVSVYYIDASYAYTNTTYIHGYEVSHGDAPKCSRLR